jgi:hypothetical protein
VAAGSLLVAASGEVQRLRAGSGSSDEESSGNTLFARLKMLYTLFALPKILTKNCISGGLNTEADPGIHRIR